MPCKLFVMTTKPKQKTTIIIIAVTVFHVERPCQYYLYIYIYIYIYSIKSEGKNNLRTGIEKKKERKR